MSGRRLAVRTAAGLLMFLTCGTTRAFTLADAYRASKEFAPQWRMERYDRDFGRLNEDLALADLLPQIGASASIARTRGRRVAPDIFQQEVTTDLDYESHSSGVQIRQTLFDLSAIQNYRKGKAQARYAENRFRANEQQLTLDVASAYLDVLVARAATTAAQGHLEALREQAALNRNAVLAGEATKTDVLETAAALHVAEADLAAADGALLTAQQALVALCGPTVSRSIGEIAGIEADFMGMPQPAQSVDDILARALAANETVLAQRESVRMAKHELSKRRYAPMPTLSLIANYANNDSDTINTIDNQYETRSIGLQVSMPLYTGGALTAEYDQAEARYNREVARLDKLESDVRQDTLTALQSLSISKKKIDALRASLAASKAVIEATRKSIEAGTRINLDLLKQINSHFDLHRRTIESAADNVLAYLYLRDALGDLGEKDIEVVSARLGTRPANSPSPDNLRFR